MEISSNSNSTELAIVGLDPFVSPRVVDQSKAGSIEEILQRMNGFVSDLNKLDSTPAEPTVSPVSTRSLIWRGSPLSDIPKPVVVSSSLKVAGNRTTLGGLADKSPSNSNTSSDHSNQTKASQPDESVGRASQSGPSALVYKSFAAVNREAEIPIDIRDYASLSQSIDDAQTVAPQLEPIQSSFDFDMEHFERNALLKKIDGLRESGEAVSDSIPSSTQQSKATFQVEKTPEKKSLEEIKPLTRNHSSEPVSGILESLPVPPARQFSEKAPSQDSEAAEPSDVQAEVVWVRENELIHVDGRDGYDYIDLTCFEISQASFEANRIRINSGVRVFEIDYRNVSHAVFANGTQVELAAYEPDFPRPSN